MKTLIQSCTVFVIYLLLSSHALAWSPFGPKTYEDCILQGMKGVTSDVAARAVQRACRTKFPNSSATESQLVRDCSVTYSGGKFVRGSPMNPSNYVAVTFQNSTSKLYLPESMLSGEPEMKAARQFMIDNSTSIREICSDIILPKD